MKLLLDEIKACHLCEQYLPFGANPVMLAGEKSKIIIVGQAPGRKVHETLIPWNDKSGDNLRAWMGVDRDLFYDTDFFALMPMGFCYPGRGNSGDLPPRKECAPKWHKELLQMMPDKKLFLLVGQYAQNYYLGDKTKATLTETVKNFREYLPLFFPLPHPSPRNNIWQAKNPWFKQEVLPTLKEIVTDII
ncbi:IclR family transcriptional regulator [Pelobium manganitolerans]|uniref:IclR family transcriptional regulator n=1 Tax=Pelobium manganitolerans TaxID=1842495 RepID=A0A419S3Y0_9SPHI|nr:uracil-DNA glycosylase family protein [Pelobium manganitolerans]RKD14364.1 IclR family transcriptional regulator [Pelobium manganitolerans]